MVLGRATALVRVDPRTRTREQVTVTLPVVRADGSDGSFPFSFTRERVTALEVLWERHPGRVVTGPLRVIGEGVRRSREWSEREAFDGARKILYYDECSAFDEPLEGPEALLVLAGHDGELDAHQAAMGAGFLPLRHRDLALRELTQGNPGVG